MREVALGPVARPAVGEADLEGSRLVAPKGHSEAGGSDSGVRL